MVIHMGMGWTKAQQKVIDTRNKNILVSAAAGSGKTAVLVERIISMISEGDHPIDIDHLLVVTFTNAAAAEMRGRIGKAIDEKLLKEPDNVHLQKQISLLQSAQITTIHSFCLNVIRNYFHRIDLDPSFKIADESEITLMKSDVISEVLERWYEEGREDFHNFVESYSYSKSDEPVEKLILGLYQFAMSAPWPKSWISEKKSAFDIRTMEDMMQSGWMQELLSYVRNVLGDLLKINEAAIQICNEPGGPGAYLPALISDRELLKELVNANSYGEYAKGFRDITYARLSGKREEGVDPQQKSLVKALRDEVKNGIKDLSNQFFFQPPEEMLADMKAVQKVMQVFFDLTLDFMEAFAAKKEEKNLIDFNDLEHFALQILIEEKDGVLVPSEAALELSEQFEEILIDEYQDSNLVQETILQSISRERMGKPNRFMVGDVKQSIYKFRLAMPELFMEKYKNYSTEDYNKEDQINLYQRIDLDRNFRSRKVVLDFVNKIFEQIMQEPVGGIVYDQAASLAYGGLYETDPASLPTDMRQRLAEDVELLLVTEEDFALKSTEKNSESMERMEANDAMSFTEDFGEEPEEQAYTKREIEARVIAKRIKELVNPDSGMLVYDNKTKTHRPATYKDIVILLRSMSGWSEVFVNTLMQEGIPAYADTGTGYFQTVEIMTLLNVLRIIDNPRQDIPLVGVLYSPIVGLTTTQLALIRAIDQKNSMYTALLTYAKEGSDEKLRSQIEGFLKLLESFRAMVKYTPIHELLQNILDQTGYYYYVMAMPGGDRRRANIDMLLTQAVSFEKGSYSGLFHFIRYIEKLHKYEVDIGEAATAGEQDNTVRIMSIHKSKGLEFPIVFVGGMSKQFNTQDLRNQILLHNELGVGPEYIDSVNRTKVPTLLKKVIQKKVQVENLGEELRVLYVAMTRAREKLIMTGYLKSLEKIKQKDFTFFEMISAKTYLDWVLPAMVNRIGTSLSEKNKTLYLKQEDMVISIIHKDNLLMEEVKNQVFLHKDKEELLSIHPEESFNKEYREEITKRFDYQYPYRQESKLKVKMTVSELKRLGQLLDDEDSEKLYPEQNSRINDHSDLEQQGTSQKNEDFEPTIPSFIRQKEEITTGADRGTIYHKVLKLLDLTKIESMDELKQQLTSMVQNKKLKESEINLLNIHQIYRFTTSNIASRMRKAQMEHKLYREQQFVIGVKAKEISKEFDSDELILIQGIIDVFFEEDGELVLLDYKSDYVQEEKQLIQRYEVQLDYYRKALEQMFQKNVKERIIYSLHLGKEIRID